MLNILVVDDEKYIRKGISATIKEAGAQFDICGEAGNGQEALSLIEKHMPDVVITDIKMPKMDGIELVGRINTDYPKIRKIILSGFDEFEYVRKSMINGAVDYLLKPVDEEQVKNILLAIEEDIKAEKKKDTDGIEEKNKINESLSILKDKFLVDLVAGKVKISDEETKVKLEQFNLPQEEGRYCIVIVSMDNYDYLSRQMPDETDIKLSGIKEALKKLDDEGTTVSSFTYDNNIIVLGALGKSGDTPEQAAEDIFAMLPEDIRAAFSLGAGECVSKITEIDTSYKSALKNLELRFYKFERNIFAEPKKANNFTFITFQDIYNTITEKIKDHFYAGKKELLINSLDALALRFSEKMISPHEVTDILTKVYLKIESESTVFKQICSEIYGLKFSYTDTLKTFDCLQQMIEFTAQYYSDIADKMKECSSIKSKEIVERVKRYILNNYKKDLSLKEVAEIVYLNPNYLSEIFKCRTGENFIEYITRIRIDHAKKLLRDLGYKTYQVGQMVGYEDPSYFSKVFKKTVGVSPSRYRDTYR